MRSKNIKRPVFRKLIEMPGVEIIPGKAIICGFTDEIECPNCTRPMRFEEFEH